MADEPAAPPERCPKCVCGLEKARAFMRGIYEDLNIGSPDVAETERAAWRIAQQFHFLHKRTPVPAPEKTE